jgi:multiple sugar transport system ATP-binding protein
VTEIRLENIRKAYGKVEVIHGIDLQVDSGDFVVFVGPSGCGKSTLLRIIAGLEDITSGTLFIDGKPVNTVTAAERGLSMVFQSYALYPHMSVYKNMAFGLENAKMPRAEIDAKVREAAALLQITDYLDRKPKALSGGQRQRVAIGRAIVRNPKAFLFDEPLSNLDAVRHDGVPQDGGRGLCHRWPAFCQRRSRAPCCHHRQLSRRGGIDPSGVRPRLAAAARRGVGHPLARR